YAAGHALVVLVLGVSAILLATRLPGAVDTVMERVVGVTLLALGTYIVVGLLREGRSFRMRSRWMLVIEAARRLRRRRASARRAVEVIEHEHDHHHDAHHHAPAHGHSHGPDVDGHPDAPAVAAALATARPRAVPSTTAT